ncbi:phosphate ABC transporter substrate-binding protein PstS [Jatrophihabitans sp. YIM 134969]
MKTTRLGAAIAGAAAIALALTACGSDNNSTGGGGGSSDSASGGGASVSCPDGSSSISGAGSSAQANAMDQWITDFAGVCKDEKVQYDGTAGSGAGVTNFTGKQIDWAGSDAALNADKGETTAAEAACGSPAWNLPMVVGPIALAYKLNGVTDLTLTPSVAAQILLGKITTWNDSKIAAINSGVSLPSTKITVFYRSDDSGTTNNVEKYLAAAAPQDFTDTPDKTWSNNTGAVGQGVKGSAGIQQGVQSTDGAIGYVEYSYAQEGNLSVAKIDNGGGAVELTTDTASKAVEAAKVTGTDGDLTLSLDYATKEAGAYPLILVTYEIVCSKYADAAKGEAIKSFLTYTAGDGQGALADLGYAPLPSEILTQVQASVAKIA